MRHTNRTRHFDSYFAEMIAGVETRLLPKPDPPHAIDDHRTVRASIRNLHRAAGASVKLELADRREIERRGLGALIDGQLLHAFSAMNHQRHIGRESALGAEAEAELVAA